MTPAQVALVSPYSFDHPGGVQSHVLELARRLVLAGDRVSVIGPGVEGIESVGFDVVEVGRSVGIRANGAVAPIGLDPRMVGRVQEAIYQAEVVHIHEPLMPLVGWAALRHPARVLTFHADPSSLVRRGYKLVAPFIRRVLRTATVTAVSELAASGIRPFSPRVEIVPNGLDTAHYRVEAKRVHGRVTFLGRNDHRKGLDVLLTAWPAIRAAAPDATLVVLGSDGPDGDGVTFLGRVDEATKRRELAMSTVFCAPNRGGESFGITLLEGMASGNAVVASDLPAFRAVAGGTARYVPPEDPSALAAAVSDLLSDSAAAAQLGADGVVRSQRYDWDEIVPTYRRIYQQVRSTRRP